MRQNRERYFMGRARYRPEFRKVYGYRLGYRFVVMPVTSLRETQSPEVYRIGVLGLESGRSQQVLFVIADQDQDFQISFFVFDANTIIQ